MACDQKAGIDGEEQEEEEEEEDETSADDEGEPTRVCAPDPNSLQRSDSEGVPCRGLCPS
jgi:hypothetical protein